MTPDPSDRASELEEGARRDALLTGRKPEAPAATGCCLYCSERLPKPLRWCDADCRNSYEDMMQRKRNRLS